MAYSYAYLGGTGAYTGAGAGAYAGAGLCAGSAVARVAKAHKAKICFTMKH